MRLLSPKDRDIAYKQERDTARIKTKELNEEFVKILKSYNLSQDDLEHYYSKYAALKDWEDKLTLKEENLSIRDNNCKLKEKEVLAFKEECSQLLDKILKVEETLRERSKVVSDKEIKFDNFRTLQQSLLKREKQSLRDWLELERGKLKICQDNLLD